MTLTNRILAGLIAGTLAVLAAINTYLLFHFAAIPLVINEAAITNSPVQQGKDLIVSYTGDRKVLCKTDGDVVIFRIPEMLLVYSVRRAAGFSPLGTSSGLIPFSTDNLKPGKYLLRVFIYNDCGDRLHTIEVPDMSFEIVE